MALHLPYEQNDILKLLSQNHSSRRLDCSCLENLNEIKDYPNYKFVKGNICSSELVSYVLDVEKIDTIMHFAAQTHVDNSFGNSFQFTQVTMRRLGFLHS
jgi:dTDP-D-glucose 4,6-dehydratase